MRDGRGVGYTDLSMSITSIRRLYSVRAMRRLTLLMVIFVVLIGTFNPLQIVAAVSDWGPDGGSGDYSAGDAVHVVVSEVGPGNSLEAKISYMYVYSPVSQGNQVRIGIRGADHCANKFNPSMTTIDSSNPGLIGTNTWFEFFSSVDYKDFHNQVRDVGDEAGDINGPCNSQETSIAITASDADRPGVNSGLHDFYRVKIKATIAQPGSVNAFKVHAQNPGAIASYANDSGDRFAIQQRSGGGFSDFHIKFATPCDINSGGEVKDLSWFDADASQFGQLTSGFRFVLEWRPRGSSGAWQPVGPPVSGVGDLGDNGAGSERTRSYTFFPSNEYQWSWLQVAKSNGIQFQIPYDSAYARATCEGTDFNLDPHISLSSSYITPGMANIGVSSNVHNSGTTASFSNEEWRITRYTVDPSSGQVQVWNGNRTFPANSVTTLTSGWLDGIDQNLAPGTRVCYVLSVEKGSTADPTWKSSAPACATVVYTPFAYVLGNDLRVGSQFMSSTPNRPSGVQGYVTTRGGSWVEYGLLAPNAINGFASQSGARVGVTPDPSNSQSWSELTFANTGLSGCAYIQKGCFSNADVLGTIPRVENVLTTTTAGVTRTNITGSVNATAVAPGICGTVTASRIIHITGSLRIDCDIRQPTSGIGSAADIHQLVLVATGDITIVSSVAQIDAWVVSKGKLDTCDGVAMTSLRDNVCNTQLRINGPVMARTLELKRTYTDPTRNRAAEELNLRGDAYIWAHTVSRNNATWQTTYTTDLPPRY